MRAVFLCFSIFLLMGCAETLLDNELEKVERELKFGSLTMSEAVQYNIDVSNAYARAARSTSGVQDALSSLVFVGASATILGAVEGVADEILAERAVGGALAGQVALRIAPQDSIKALYEGAQRTNCLAAIGQLYSERVQEPSRAAFILVLMSREVYFQTLAGISRAPADFSTISTALNDAVPARTEGDKNTSADRSAVEPSAIEIEAFYKLAASCLGPNGALPAKLE